MKKRVGLLAMFLTTITVITQLISVARADDTHENEAPLALHLFPKNQQIKEGNSASWYLTAAGEEPFQYQWKQDGKNVPGGTGNTLRFVAVKPTDAGIYSCTITNKLGSAESESVNLSVLSPGTLTTSQKIDIKKAPTNNTALAGSSNQP